MVNGLNVVITCLSCVGKRFEALSDYTSYTAIVVYIIVAVLLDSFQIIFLFNFSKIIAKLTKITFETGKFTEELKLLITIITNYSLSERV